MIGLIAKRIFKFRNTTDLVMENLALRQQLAIMKRTTKRPQLHCEDRLFWVFLCRFWRHWREVLIIVKPDTVVRWHKQGFKLFWKRKSRHGGRSPIKKEIRDLVLKMANANPFWGAPRIHGELLKLGIEICERTVSNLMPARPPKPPSQTWRAFLKNHMHNTCSMDFFVIPTATFKILFALVILSHDRRKVVNFNVTTNPSAKWTAQQVVEAFPWNRAPKYLLRDRDSIYGGYFRRRVKNMGINEVIAAPQSPWQNPYVERLIGSIRRDCLNHVIVLNEKHLKQILSSYFEYYHYDRTHYSLDKDTPIARPMQHRPDNCAKVIKLPRVGGLHHRYEWRQAA